MRNAFAAQLNNAQQRLALALALALASVGWAQTSSAQEFPRRAVTMIVAAAPGGGLDLISRAAARALSEEWKQPVVVDNRGGASGVIGTEFVYRAAPDTVTSV